MEGMSVRHFSVEFEGNHSKVIVVSEVQEDSDLLYTILCDAFSKYEADMEVDC